MTAAGKRWAWLAGFLISVNVYLVPSSTSSPRATDLVGALLGLWILGRVVRGRQNMHHLALVVFAVLPPGLWALVGFLDGDPATVVQGLRWVLAAPWALAMLLILDRRQWRIRLAWGLVHGGLVNVAVIVLQRAGFESLLIRVGLSSAGAAFNNYVAYMVRYPGLHGQHNASSAVISLMIPAGIYLYLHRRCSLAVFMGLLASFLVAVHLTSTRSPLLAATLTMAVAAATSRRSRRVLPAVGLVLVLVLPVVAIYGPPGGWARWRNEQAVVVNATERVDSNVGAIELSLRHPLGMGVTPGRTALGDLTSFAAAHNAFLEASLVFGVGFGFLILLGVGRGILGLAGGTDGTRYLVGLLALQAAGLFMFEEHLNNPTFIILALWCIASLAWRPPRESGPEDPLPVR